MKKTYLKAEIIYKYIMGDEELDTLIMCKPEKVELVTTDQSLYEALGSIDDKSKINYNKLVKFLESVEIISFSQALKKERKILREKRVEEIKQKAKNAVLNIQSEEEKNAGQKN